MEGRIKNPPQRLPMVIGGFRSAAPCLRSLHHPHLIRLHKAFRDPIDLHQQLTRRT